MKPIIFIVMLNYTIFVIKLIASFFFYGKINGIVSLIKREGGGGDLGFWMGREGRENDKLRNLCHGHAWKFFK